jgi:hypothetical protein
MDDISSEAIGVQLNSRAYSRMMGWREWDWSETLTGHDGPKNNLTPPPNDWVVKSNLFPILMPRLFLSSRHCSLRRVWYRFHTTRDIPPPPSPLPPPTYLNLFVYFNPRLWTKSCVIKVLGSRGRDILRWEKASKFGVGDLICPWH